MTNYPDSPTPDHIHLLRAAAWLLTALILGLLAAAAEPGPAAAGAQSKPEPLTFTQTPTSSQTTQPNKPTRLDFYLLATDAAVRSLDAYSTRRALTCTCNHETELPDFIAYRTPAMIFFSAGMVGLDWWAARRLERHGHARLAHTLTLIDLSGTGIAVGRNLTLPGKQKTGPQSFMSKK